MIRAISQRVSLTPAGVGALFLVFPGMLLCVLSEQPPLIAASVGALLLLLVNLVWSWRLVRNVDISITHSGVASVGEKHSFEIASLNHGGVDFDLCIDRLTDGKPIALRSAAASNDLPRATVAATMDRRGVFDSVATTLSTSFPFGLVCCVNRSTIQFDQPLYIAPPKIRCELADPPASLTGRGGLAEESPAGLRPYEPGDRQRDVDWKSLARSGNLLVRERSAAQTEVLEASLIADLSVVDPARSAEADLALGKCRYLAEQLLQRGFQLLLITVERQPGESEPGTVSEPVRSSHDVARRLAAAVAGERCDVATGAGLTVVVGLSGANWVEG